MLPQGYGEIRKGIAEVIQRKELQKGGEKMRVHTFLVELKNGEIFRRGEWGKTIASASKAIRSAYGENLKSLVALA